MCSKSHKQIDTVLHVTLFNHGMEKITNRNQSLNNPPPPTNKKMIAGQTQTPE